MSTKEVLLAQGEEVSERELEEMFDDFLDECFDGWKFGSLEYEPSLLLKRVDPIAYRQDLCTYIDGLISDEYIGEYDGKYYRLHG